MHINIITLVLAGVLGLVFLWFTLKSTETWLIVAILAHLVLFLHKRAAAEASVYQAVAYSAIFFPGLFWWFAKRLAKSKKIVEHWSEFALIAFIGFALFSIGWAWMYDFSPAKGIREFALFLPYLMYFPLRDYVAENDEKYVVIALLFVAMTVAIFDIVEYRLTMITAHYFWQVLGARENVGEELMVSAIVIMFGFIGAKRYNFYLIAALIAVSTIALVLTFSRGYWGTGAFGLLLLVFVLKGSPRKRIVKFGMFSAVAAALVAAILFPRLLLDLVKGLGTRIGQVAGRDLSLQSRLAESSAVLQHFIVSPVVGYGMGAEFSFFNPIGNMTATSWYIHDGYLFMLYKFGLAGTVLYFLFFVRMLLLTGREAAAAIDEKTKILLFSFFCIVVSMVLVSFTSPQFYDRVGILVLTTVCGISSGISKRKTLNAPLGEI